MLSRSGRPLAQVLFSPFARACVRMGITADAITITGTILSVAAALTFLPLGWLWQGALLIAVLVIFDNLDGQIARLTGTASKWGAFLDSTLDRLCDAAIFVGILLWAYIHEPRWEIWFEAFTLAALVFGSVVPYARARAEGLGMTASVGIAERADRLVVVLVAILVLGIVGANLFSLILLAFLAVSSFVTVIQRILYVRGQARQMQAEE